MLYCNYFALFPRYYVFVLHWFYVKLFWYFDVVMFKLPWCCDTVLCDCMLYVFMWICYHGVNLLCVNVIVLLCMMLLYHCFTVTMSLVILRYTLLGYFNTCHGI